MGSRLTRTLRRLSAKGVEEWAALRIRAYGVTVDWLSNCPAEHLLFVGHGGFLEALGNSLEVELGACKHATPYVFRSTGSSWTVREISIARTSQPQPV